MRFTAVEGQVQVISVNAGTQAESHPQLHAGLVLTVVGGQSVVGMSYKKALEKMRACGRPVTLEFTETVVAATFTKPGSLGLGFVARKGQTQLQKIHPGSQAENQPQLRAGLVLITVDGQSVVDASYQDVISLIKLCGRPVTLEFRSDA